MTDNLKYQFDQRYRWCKLVPNTIRWWIARQLLFTGQPYRTGYYQCILGVEDFDFDLLPHIHDINMTIGLVLES